MKKNKKRLWKRILCLCIMTCLLIGNTVCLAAETTAIWVDTKYDGDLYPIMGNTSTSLSQMINYYESKASYPSFYASSDAPNIYEFCKIYLEESAAEGVKAEVAFTQAMKETNFLRYGGDVSITQYNFAGLGATGGGNPGNSFSSVRIGVRAQIQHLKAYATSAPLVNEQVDPRYKYVNKGSAPYVQWLGKYENPSGIGWATAVNYGYSIVNDYMSVLKSSSTFSSWYNGTNYADVYNPDYYMLHNPDVAANCGSNSDTLIRHFINNGMAEGRIASENFDINLYRNRYADLRKAYGDTLQLYYYHYMQMGKAEGRIASGGIWTSYDGRDYSSVYDYQYYVDNNPDVENAFEGNDIQTIVHFVNYGMKEGRRGNQSFDVNYYRLRYPDLQAAFGNDLQAYYIHYMDYGKSEGRLAHAPTTTYNGVDYSPVYDYDYYISANPDVAAVYTSDTDVLQHFVEYGMKEGRLAKASFDVNSYRNANQDLRIALGSDLQAYYMHYIQFGRNEGRTATDVTELQNAITTYGGIDYALVYDMNYYLSENPDVKNAVGADENAAIQHFVEYGMKEGRLAKASFNVYTYKAKYSDLVAAFGDNLENYYYHYINNGYSEGRNCE